MSKKVNKFWCLVGVLFLAVLAMAQLPGCGGGGSSNATGTLKVGLTDAQSDDFANVFITIKEVRVVPAGLENAADDDSRLPVIATFADPQPIDILTLRFHQELLGQIVLPAGSYNQVRLVLAPNPTGQGQDLLNYVVLKSTGATVAVKTPSGQQSGMKVLGKFEVKAGVINAIIIDFDPNTAIVKRNDTYNVKPTGIRIVQATGLADNFGSLSGTVSSVQKNWSSATVSVIPQGSTTAIAAGNIFSNISTNSAPFSTFVPGGSALYRVHVQAAGFVPYSSAPTTVAIDNDTSIGNVLLVPQP